MANKKTRAVALLVATCMMGAPLVRAGDLNSEFNAMFDSMGGVGNYTAPGAFRGQALNTFSGGSLMMRVPNKRFHRLVSIDPPFVRAGCNGIDINGGSITMMGKDEFVNTLKQFKSSMKAVAFQLAIKSVSPLFGGVTEYLKELESKLSISSKSSCELATMAFDKMSEVTGASTYAACIKIAMDLGIVDSRPEAEKKCAENYDGVIAQAKNSTDPNIASMPPFTGNLVWQALLQGNNSGLDNDDRELIMSVIGTVIYDQYGRQKQSVQATITTPQQLLAGEDPTPDENGNSKLTMLKCNDYTDCLEPEAKQVTVRPMSPRVRKMMRDIAEHIRERVEFGKDSKEVAFVNTVNEPVYRMMAIATSGKDESSAEGLINRYGDLIAADYVISILSRTLRFGMHALTQRSQLTPQQVQDADALRSTARTMLSSLGHEKNSLYAKVVSAESMTRELERLQVSLRTNSPATVLRRLARTTGVRN